MRERGLTVGPMRHAGTTAGIAMALTLALSSVGAAQVIVGGYPYPAYRYAARDSAVRFDVKPREAAVYVDGYYAGVVDDYDGVFQRLYTAPGGHEVTLYLEGYRTYSEHVYLAPDTTFKFRHRMEPLAAGQIAERPPQPAPPPEAERNPGQPGEQPPLPRGPYGRRGVPPNYPPNLPPPPQGGQQPPPGPPPTEGNRGTLSLSIQPGDAEVLVDGT